MFIRLWQANTHFALPPLSIKTNDPKYKYDFTLQCLIFVSRSRFFWVLILISIFFFEWEVCILDPFARGLLKCAQHILSLTHLAQCVYYNVLH